MRVWCNARTDTVVLLLRHSSTGFYMRQHQLVSARTLPTVLPIENKSNNHCGCRSAAVAENMAAAAAAAAPATAAPAIATPLHDLETMAMKTSGATGACPETPRDALVTDHVYETVPACEAQAVRLSTAVAHHRQRASGHKLVMPQGLGVRFRCRASRRRRLRRCLCGWRHYNYDDFYFAQHQAPEVGGIGSNAQQVQPVITAVELQLVEADRTRAAAERSCEQLSAGAAALRQERHSLLRQRKYLVQQRSKVCDNHLSMLPQVNALVLRRKELEQECETLQQQCSTADQQIDAAAEVAAVSAAAVAHAGARITQLDQLFAPLHQRIHPRQHRQNRHRTLPSALLLRSTAAAGLSAAVKGKHATAGGCGAPAATALLPQRCFGGGQLRAAALRSGARRVCLYQLLLHRGDGGHWKLHLLSFAAGAAADLTRLLLRDVEVVVIVARKGVMSVVVVPPPQRLVEDEVVQRRLREESVAAVKVGHCLVAPGFTMLSVQATKRMAKTDMGAASARSTCTVEMYASRNAKKNNATERPRP
ncbi:hypothetical protein JKP88DRAFT_254348 [Tribonema minus]|uniref:Uncharacterized protein n=1 Tax=Tribonema minus TaxID=303371 RepID=A0A835Z6V6_9STRA|nr:hypothetical protein JKP88DRAFT_254348 [Tribonema minus]